MNAKRVVLLTVLGSALLTFLTFFALPASGQAPPRQPLTPNQMQLVAQKEEARRAAGVPAQQPGAGPFAGRDTPVRRFTGQVRTTKAQLLADFNAATPQEQTYIARLERESGPAAAQRARDAREQRRREIEALPDGPIELQIPAVEAGQHSISYSIYTYPNGSVNPIDPINVIFYRVGGSWSVAYDLNNWTSRRWGGTNCGSFQRVFIWDAAHTGGRDDWRGMEFQMEPLDAPPICGGARDHLRLFGGFVTDSHSNGFGNWSITDVHHDRIGHLCADHFDGPQGRLVAAFRDANGIPLWFVGAIWDSNLGNGGQPGGGCSGTNNDGWGTYIELYF